MKPSKKFSLLGVPLSGIQLIEASAGTGKTHTITDLYLRLILEREDIQAEQILVVTFTEAATEELRDRIRKKLRRASDAFSGKDCGDDPSITLLGRSAGEGRNQNPEASAEDAIVGSWQGEFSSEGGRHQLGEAILTVTKTGPGVYQLQVTSGWVKTGYREDAPYFTGCMLRAEVSRDMVYGFTMYVYRGESGSYFSDGTPKPVTIRLTPGSYGAPPDVQVSIADARNTGFRSLTKVQGR